MLIVEATPPPLHGEQQHIHLTGKKKVESQQFLSKSADSPDRVKESSGRETKTVYHAQHWGCKHCNAGLIFEVAFHVQFRYFPMHGGLIVLMRFNYSP